MVQKGIDEVTGKTFYPLNFQRFRRVLAGRKTRHISARHTLKYKPQKLKPPRPVKRLGGYQAMQENTAHGHRTT
jgi:hypothetical protein